jgi:hypothetical protein
VLLECLATRTVRKPYEGCFLHGELRFAVEEARRLLIETLWAGWLWRVIALAAKAERGSRVKARARRSQVSPGRAKPKGGSGGRRAKHPLAARDSLGAKHPEAASHRAGPAPSGGG